MSNAAQVQKDQPKSIGYCLTVTKAEKTTYLILFNHNGKSIVKWNEKSYGDNYPPLLKRIRREYAQVGAEHVATIHQTRERLYRNIGKTAGLFIALFSLYQLLFMQIIPTEELQELSVTLSEQPQIEEKRKGRIANATYRFENHPAYQFKVVGQSFHLLTPIAKTLDAGTPLKVKILKSDYEQKIQQTKTPSFTNKHINWELITLYEMTYNDQKILSFKDLNDNKVNPIPKFLLLLLGLGLFVYYSYLSKGYD